MHASLVRMLTQQAAQYHTASICFKSRPFLTYNSKDHLRIGPEKLAGNYWFASHEPCALGFSRLTSWPPFMLTAGVFSRLSVDLWVTLSLNVIFRHSLYPIPSALQLTWKKGASDWPIRQHTQVSMLDILAAGPVRVRKTRGLDYTWSSRSA